jgi:hypothetical protein
MKKETGDRNSDEGEDEWNTEMRHKKRQNLDYNNGEINEKDR